MNYFVEKLRLHARERPNAVAVRHCATGGTSAVTTWHQLSILTTGFASVFRKLNPGRILPILLPKSAVCVAAMLGALSVDEPFATPNRKLRAPQIQQILQTIGSPTVGVTDGPGATLLAQMTVTLPDCEWWVVRDEALRPAHQHALDRLRKSFFLRIWPEDIPKREVNTAAIPSTDSNRPACCLFTSGSTGTPKGVLIGAADLEARVLEEQCLFELTAGDVLLSILPFSFDVGLNQLLTAVSSGCEIVLLDSWLPADILRATGDFGVSGISAVPAIWSDMLTAGFGFETGTAHRALRYLTISGGDLTASQLESLPSLAPGVKIFKTYGQTETFRSTVLLPHEFEPKRASVGRAFGEARIYIVRGDGTICRPYEVGEIVHTGLGVMLGYLDRQDPQNKLRLNPFGTLGDSSPMAVYTGDDGCLDSEGFLYIKGRRDAMLKVAGNRVYPAEIINHLSAFSGVREAKVIGVDLGGQTRLVAFITVAQKHQRSEIELRRDLAGRLPSYMVPAHIVILSALPRTANGKLDRQALARFATNILVNHA